MGLGAVSTYDRRIGILRAELRQRHLRLFRRVLDRQHWLRPLLSLSAAFDPAAFRAPASSDLDLVTTGFARMRKASRSPAASRGSKGWLSSSKRPRGSRGSRAERI